jgi:hypothetical protein
MIHRLSLRNPALRATARGLAAAVLVFSLTTQAGARPLAPSDAFVRVSPRDPRYFELSDGQAYVPIGLNLIAPGAGEPDGLAVMENWMRQLSENGGNFIRVWISSPFWDIEHERSGVYDQSKARRIDEMLAMAARHGLRVKLTLEHFREMSAAPRQPWANKPLHLVASGGTAASMADFFSGESSRARFRQKLEWLARRHGDNPVIFGWELWNEINAVTTTEEHYLPWTVTMLAELRQLFPRNLAMQSLGSFDTPGVRDLYRRHSLLEGNDVAQVHRYLDLGARLEICHGPMDILAADAVREISNFNPSRPVILAEGGAVEPRHTGPFNLYARDTEGMLLHDVLFAPFFAGSAGPGQIWHWGVYVDRNRLWRHFGRFAAIIDGIDVPAENFEPVEIAHPRLRIYVLKGRTTVLAWCRDSENTWETELAEERPPDRLEGLRVDFKTVSGLRHSEAADIYDPWSDTWSRAQREGSHVLLPEFSRSILIRFHRAGN